MDEGGIEEGISICKLNFLEFLLGFCKLALFSQCPVRQLIYEIPPEEGRVGDRRAAIFSTMTQD